MRFARLSILLLTCFLVLPSFASTWYVRSDGGTRYSANVLNGQCNGLSDVAYPGSGVNQNCAFNDARFFWTDGTYCTDNSPTSACWRWVGTGGDTYIIRGSIADGVSYRIGYNGPNPQNWQGSIAGNPYVAAPPPPSGTSSNHTQLLGGNYASCTTPSARTQLHGGYGVGTVLDLSGVSYVDVACFDITDFSSCGRSSQTNMCQSSYPLDDYASSGIVWSNTSTNDTLTNVRIHGTAGSGMYGPTGTGVVMSGIDIVGNAAAGWNADNGTTGTGTLLVQNYNISWNGCAEEYPITHTLPYQDCTDDNIGGYGDGFGTATVSSYPAWTVKFDQGVVSYNTQDGLDALHLIGAGSSMSITRTRAFGNMGQQIKVGGAAGSATNNIITTNCNAMQQSIPGTPSGYNSRLSDFCRAADTGIYLTTGKNANVTFQDNTVYSASATAIQIGCDDSSGACDSTSTAAFRNNLFIGFLNNSANGYAGGGTGDYSNPIYITSPVDPFQNAGSIWTNNLTFHPKSTWTCPHSGEQSAICNTDPQLADETWHLYGDGNATPLPSSPVKSAGVSVTGVTIDYNGNLRMNPPSIGAIEVPSAPSPTFVASSSINSVVAQNSVPLNYACTHAGDTLVAFGYSSTGAVTAPTLTDFTLGPVSGSPIGMDGNKTIFGFYGATCPDVNSHTYTFNYSTMFANYNALQIVEFTPGTYAGGGVSPNPNSYSYLEASATTSTSSGAAIVFGATQGFPDGPIPTGYTVDSHTPNYTYTYWFTAYNNSAYTAPGTVSFQMPLYNTESFPAVIMLLH